LSKQVLSKSVIEDELFSIAIENGAEEFEREGDYYIITTEAGDLYKVKQKILEKNKNIEIEEASLEMIPKNLINCSKEDEEKNKKLINYLENIEDVDEVYHNMA
jgi:transcriptional/translational regulatory protein YebC/TACO1